MIVKLERTDKLSVYNQEMPQTPTNLHVRYKEEKTLERSQTKTHIYNKQ